MFKKLFRHIVFLLTLLCVTVSPYELCAQQESVASAGTKNLTKLTFMPNWLPQAQFAGYYIARIKGFYEEEGLDVTIRHLPQGSTYSVLDCLNEGAVDIISNLLITCMTGASKGYDLVNVLQTSQHGSLVCVAQDSIGRLEDFAGRKVGIWRSGNGECAESAFMESNVKVNWIPFIRDINIFIFKAVDATLAYSYSEYLELLLCKGDIPENHVLRFSDYGYDFPEDGLYVKSSYLKENRETVEAFVRASKKGWEWAAEHKEEAVDLVWHYLKPFQTGTSKYYQSLMLDEVLRLQVKDGERSFRTIGIDEFNSLKSKLLKGGMMVNDIDYNKFTVDLLNGGNN